MARRRTPSHATLYDFRDLDLMLHLHDADEGKLTTHDVADLLGFEAEDGGRAVGIRLAWMRRYGMVAFDDRERTWSLSPSGGRVTEANLRAPELRVIEQMPDEKMIETMALVTSRFQRGEPMIAQMLRREFLYGTKRRNGR
jgi:hypothetical protein